MEENFVGGLVHTDKSPDTSAVNDFSELTQHAHRRQMEDDLVTAMDVDQAFSNWQDEVLHHPETGYLWRQGKDARGLFEVFQEESELKYLELNDGLENENQRALFETRFQDHMQWSQNRIASHEAREVDLHRRTSLGKASIFESRRAVERMNEGDADGAAEALDTAVRFLGQSLSGMPQDQRDEAQSMLVSGYHGEVFKRQLEADPFGAAQYVFKNQNAIRPDIYEELRQTAERKIEKVEGRALFERVYSPETELESLFQSIDASDAPEQQKSIARELVEDRKATQQAEQIALEKQQIALAEEASISAVQMIDQGTAFNALSDDLIGGLTPEHRKAVQAVFLQKLSGEVAPHNAPLELELHESWISYVNGESTAFLELPLASQYGSHNRARLDLWIQRQAQLKRGDPRILEEINRRKFAFNRATEFIAEAVTERTADPADRTRMQDQLNEAAITYINHWHEANPGQMMEPKALVDTLEVMVGPLPSSGPSHPHVEDFIAFGDQHDVTNTDTDQDTQENDGGLPDAVTRALQGFRMDEHGNWFDENGNPVDNPFRDPNFQAASMQSGGAKDTSKQLDEDISGDKIGDLERATQKINDIVQAGGQGLQTTNDEVLGGMSKETINELGELVLSVLPGTGNVLSARDAVVALMAAREAVKRGEYSEAAINGLLATLGVVGAIPGPGILARSVRKLAKGLLKGKMPVARAAKGMGRLAESERKILGKLAEEVNYLDPSKPAPTPNYLSRRINATPGRTDTRNPISVKEYNKLDDTGFIDPDIIHTLQDSVHRVFKDEKTGKRRTLKDTVNQLIDEPRHAENIPPILIAEYNGKIFALDNRRLVAHRIAGVKVKFRKATAEELDIALNRRPIGNGKYKMRDPKGNSKYTTMDGGNSIRLR